MKTPICNICLNSEILCSACQERLTTGKISKNEVDISRILYRMSDKAKSLKDVTIKGVIETPNSLIIVSGKGDAPKVIGSEGSNVKRITTMIGKRARVIEEAKDIKEFIQNLIFPAAVLRMNTLYTPTGERIKIVIPKSTRLPMMKNELDEIVKAVFNQHINIHFE